MGTPALAVPCLDALGREHEIIAVVTQPDKIGGRGHELLSSAVKQRALELEIPVLQPARARAESFIAEMRYLAPDAIAVVAYGQILPREILDIAPRGCVNLHYSLLPRWRGAAPVQYAIWNGDKTTGVTTQWMAEKLDAGDVISQREVEILPLETSGELLERLTFIGADFLQRTFQLLKNQSAPRTPQDESKVTFCPQISREMASINWQKPAQEIENLVRAMNPWPVAHFEFKGTPLKVLRAQKMEDSAAPGTILKVDKDGILVAAGQNALQLIEVQAAGKPKMKAGDWARGARLEVGARLT
ncbi:methionyl-tRNA formyltransferase [Abditibacterium utsteinense]|uniref:Methionyl-tRNA formyltransferase n=2 Tax=Abditibacterium utsteinense TaxID=1960156 RepID=A0A2S8SPY0_9BACT|nr:methionyl-tRNA formyltransferase [Abditibacterium utsteinense]